MCEQVHVNNYEQESERNLKVKYSKIMLAHQTLPNVTIKYIVLYLVSIHQLKTGID